MKSTATAPFKGRLYFIYNKVAHAAKSCILAICALLIVFVCSESAYASAPTLLLEPLPMNENEEIVVNVRLTNLADGLKEGFHGIMRLNFELTFDEEKFTFASLNEDKSPVFTVDESTILKDKITGIKTVNDTMLFSFLAISLDEELITRGGVLCRFSLKPENPRKLYNSNDFYEVCFVPGSVKMAAYGMHNRQTAVIENAEALDAFVGGYSLPPIYPSGDFVSTGTVVLPTEEGSTVYIINGKEVDLGVAPYSHPETGEQYVPLRAYMIANDFDASWNSIKQTAIAATIGKSTVRRKIISTEGKSYLFVNTRLINMPSTAELSNGRIMLPFSSVKEAFGIQ